eukprot:TRINITY_DN16865_c0_g3_i1.p1 TRINITY_DN16865_c0_g3~~TRINITY_DN16865_c0_g3_i1.p1  ORF type:complete len:741 (+),score=229.68 TRINITY_DN16865_c0_g3_i1:148-2370(+)
MVCCRRCGAQGDHFTKDCKVPDSELSSAAAASQPTPTSPPPPKQPPQPQRGQGLPGRADWGAPAGPSPIIDAVSAGLTPEAETLLRNRQMGVVVSVASNGQDTFGGSISCDAVRDIWGPGCEVIIPVAELAKCNTALCPGLPVSFTPYLDGRGMLCARSVRQTPAGAPRPTHCGPALLTDADGKPVSLPNRSPQRATGRPVVITPRHPNVAAAPWVPPVQRRAPQVLAMGEYVGMVTQYDPHTGFGWLSSDELRQSYGGDALFRATPETPTAALIPGRCVVFTVAPPPAAGHHAEATVLRPYQEAESPASSPYAPQFVAPGDGASSPHNSTETGWSPLAFAAECFPDQQGADAVLCAPPQAGQRPWELDVVFFHAQCWDGLCAVYALWIAAGPRRRQGMHLVPVVAKPGTSPSSEAKGVLGDADTAIRGKHIALVDMSFPLSTLQRLLVDCASLLVIDHHKSHERDLSALAKQQPSAVRFDLSRAAAVLAFDFAASCIGDALRGGELTEQLAQELASIPAPLDVSLLMQGYAVPCPRFLHLVQEVDLGRFGPEHPETRRFAMGVEVLQYDESTPWQDRLVLPRPGLASNRIQQTLGQLQKMLQRGDELVDRVLSLGAAVEAELERLISRWLESRVIRRFRGHPSAPVAVVELPPFQSEDTRRLPLRFARNELGHRLARDQSGVWCGAVVAGNSVMLRCDPTQADVSQLAVANGGGGHATAAAFQLVPGQTLDDVMFPVDT